MTKPRPVPDGYATVTPWIVSTDTRRLLEFIKQAFDAEELGRAVAAGATVVTRLTELAWGDRVGRVRDPLGSLWWIQERVSEPTPEELARRYQDPRFTEAMHYLRSTLAHALDTT